MFGGSSQAAFPGKNSLKKCKMKKKIDNAVIIDVDTDGFPDVIVIDEPECSEQDLRGSGKSREGKKVSQQSVISIDDDESVDNNRPGVGDDGQMDFDSDASSSKKPPSFGNSRYEGTDSDFCEFVWESKRPVNLSNCKRTYSEKAPSRNRFGLGSEFEGGSSDSDCSDCEVMEGSSGKLRDQWEKAHSNRKRNVGKSQSSPEDQASASGTTNGQSDVEWENSCEQYFQVPVNSSKGNLNNENGNPFDSIPTDPYCAGGTSLDPEAEGFFTHFSSSFQFGENTFTESQPFGFDGPNLWSDQERDGRPDQTKNYTVKDQFNQGEPCLFNFDFHFNVNFGEYGVTGKDKEAASCKSQYQHGENGNNVTPDTKDREFYPEHSGSEAHCPTERQFANNCSYAEERVSGEEFMNTQSNETNFNCKKTVSEDKVGVDSEDSSFYGSPFQWKSEVCNERYVSEVKNTQILEELSTDNSQHDETRNQDPSLKETETLVESPSNTQPQDESATHTVEGCIISDREKLKETEEYKRATEEEWAARQRQLELQAEEIQKLRKRKKAENMRLLDMERRQKQRLEEIRATQKKDEENLNLKEQLRVEIRNELKRLEVTCLDMSSLLRGLGVSVQGGVHPSSHEVHAAYKRALLRFHPDRTSQASIRQQVEAEEKFKLISRMKEKLSLTYRY